MPYAPATPTHLNSIETSPCPVYLPHPKQPLGDLMVIWTIICARSSLAPMSRWYPFSSYTFLFEQLAERETHLTVVRLCRTIEGSCLCWYRVVGARRFQVPHWKLIYFYDFSTDFFLTRARLAGRWLMNTFSNPHHDVSTSLVCTDRQQSDRSSSGRITWTRITGHLMFPPVGGLHLLSTEWTTTAPVSQSVSSLSIARTRRGCAA